MPINPISFSIPESKIIEYIPTKTRKFAHIVPGDISTYIYSDEASYYKGYQESVFGKTCKKGGWDCLRHYEILANGCIPWFENLEQCPKDTMFRFPKDIVLEAMKSDTPESYIPELLEYTRNHLTCRAMAQYVLDTIGHPTPKRILFLSADAQPDYLRCLTLIGFKQILGERCVDAVYIPHIYEDYPTPEKIYGRGFSYTNIIPVSAKAPPVHIDEVREHAFDIVVYGSMHRGLPYWDIVNSTYKPNEIVFLCGEDLDVNSKKHTCLSLTNDYHKFIRERSSFVVVQVGTNNGNDHVLKLCKQQPVDKIYLVEPFSIHNNEIYRNYSTISNVTLENIAITPTPQETVTLFYTEEDGPNNNPAKSYQVASIKSEHIVKHNYIPELLQSITVNANTMNDFLDRHNLYHIDYLFLDIEGIDFEVLKSIDFSRFRIDRLQIEHLHLDKTQLHSFMQEKGYRPSQGLDAHGFDTLFIH